MSILKETCLEDEVTGTTRGIRTTEVRVPILVRWVLPEAGAEKRT